MSLRVRYESENFPVASGVAHGANELVFTWGKLLWAALTVGRPNLHAVFTYGDASVYEAIFRLSLIRMTVEQTGPSAHVLRRTAAARERDPTEKGAINYFLGMAVAKLFAAELLAVPWMLHVDVFRRQVGIKLTERSRPDLVGQNTSGDWTAVECKGRISVPDEGTKAKAKYQAQRVQSVGVTAPIHAIGAITYFRGETLRFFWRDPEPDARVRNPIKVNTTEADWNHSYALIRALMLLRSDGLRREHEVVWARVESADIDVGAHSRVWEALAPKPQTDARIVAPAWGAAAKRVALELGTQLGPCNADGLIVRAGKTWQLPFADEFAPWEV